MGSAAEVVEETVEYLVEKGEEVGLLKVRLSARSVWSTLSVCCLRRSSSWRSSIAPREPGSAGRPLYQDAITAVAETGRSIKVIGGRYGLSSKEFAPSMAKAVFDEMKKESPKNHFTVGIVDDVTNTIRL